MPTAPGRRCLFVALASCLMIGFALTSAVAEADEPAGTVYYVDYDGGSDTQDGQSANRAFKHAPGDAQARGSAAEVQLEAGDVVRFKGGVIYRGSINVTWSGSAGAPIVFDGNTDGSFGEGRAVIDGSDPVTGWQRARSADELRGNPNWRNIWHAPVPGDAEVFTVNLTQGERLLGIARDPSPDDPFFMDEQGTMRHIAPPRPDTYWPIRIEHNGRRINGNHPLELLIDGNPRSLAVVDPMDGAELTFTLDEPKTVTKLAVVQGNRPARAKDIAFIADGREILTTELAFEPGRQAFALDEPVQIEELVLEVRSIHEQSTGVYGSFYQVQALTADGDDVFAVGGESFTSYADASYFTQDDPDYFKGAYFAIWAKPNRVVYQSVIDFDPAGHKLRFERLGAEQYEGDRGQFAILNAAGAITQPGEYYLSPDVDDAGNKRIYVWPHEAGSDGPEGMSVSRRADGFRIKGREHIAIQGFVIQKHGGTASHAVYSSGGTKHLTIRDNEMRFNQSRNRDSVVAVVHGENIHIENNHLHHNRQARGFRLTISDSVVTGNRLHKNGSTGIGFFGSKRSEMSHNTVTGHTGVHANSLTVYADSEDILVEGNRAFDGNIPLTVQNSANVTVRNNILHNPAGVVVGIWSGWHRNLRIEHNLLLGADEGPDWAAAVFTNSNQIDGLHVHNNIMAGTSGNLPGEFSRNIYTRLSPNDDADGLPAGSTYLPDLDRLFAAPADRDFRHRTNSPAIDAGQDVGVERDIDGNARPYGDAPDLGAYEAQQQ